MLITCAPTFTLKTAPFENRGKGPPLCPTTGLQINLSSSLVLSTPLNQAFMNSVFFPLSPGVVPSKTGTTSFKRNDCPLCTATMLSTSFKSPINTVLTMKQSKVQIKTKHFAKAIKTQIITIILYVYMCPLLSLSINLISSQSNQSAQKLH